MPGGFGEGLGRRRLGALGALAVLTLAVGLGGSSRLTYHEAITARAAGEMLGRGDWLVPRLGGQPWLEKPPLNLWAVALAGRAAGGIDEAIARWPSAVAAALLALGVATLAARRFGANVGWLAGAIQLTTSWTVVRGRLAEADIVLACLVTWCFVALDGVRARDRQDQCRNAEVDDGSTGAPSAAPSWRATLPFSLLLGLTATVKGIGFGGVLVVASLVVLLSWDRDGKTLRALSSPPGWVLAGLVGLAWPLAVLARYPRAADVWVLHVADRLAADPTHFAGEPWVGYVLSPFAQAMPWTPLAIVGAWRSWRRAWSAEGRFGPDRLLWAWALVPAGLVSMASVRNGHYLLPALPPLSIWAATSLVRIGARLEGRGWAPVALRRGAIGLFAALGVGCGVGHLVLGPRFDPRGREWAWYATASRLLGASEPLALLYDDWDRDPYPTPFGPVPHDLAVRLFYLDHPAVCWHRGVESLADEHGDGRAPPLEPFAVIARERDLAALGRLGRVERLARGPEHRWDRAYVLVRVHEGGQGQAERRSTAVRR